MAMYRMRIAVVMGGVSAEREVSLRSGSQVASALREAGHTVVPIDLTREWIDPIVEARAEVAFLALHGRFGEDGGIQRLLAEAGIPFTGSGPDASRTGMDKVASKRLFVIEDVPTPAFRIVTTGQRWADLSRAIGDIGLPMVIKPARQGSSIGVSLVEHLDDVPVALCEAFLYGEEAVLEEKIEGREFTVGVLDDRPLPVVEVRSRRSFFDTNAKYEDRGTQFVVEPELDGLTEGVMKEIALRACEVIGCRDFSRVDFMLSEDGRPFVLEVNTIPGMTARSLLPIAAEAAGIEFVDLCDRIACAAAERTLAVRVTA